MKMKKCNKYDFDVYNDRKYDVVLECDENTRIVTKAMCCGEEDDPWGALGHTMTYCIRHVFCWCVYKPVFN
jgi:hypothetical protein